jgi:hypothetical protein
MGFNKVFLSNLDSLKNELSEIGKEEFIKKYSKYESILGSIEAVKFLEQNLKNNQTSCITSEE